MQFQKEKNPDFLFYRFSLHIQIRNPLLLLLFLSLLCLSCFHRKRFLRFHPGNPLRLLIPLPFLEARRKSCARMRRRSSRLLSRLFLQFLPPGLHIAHFGWNNGSGHIGNLICIFRIIHNNEISRNHIHPACPSYCPCVIRCELNNICSVL